MNLRTHSTWVLCLAVLLNTASGVNAEEPGAGTSTNGAEAQRSASGTGGYEIGWFSIDAGGGTITGDAFLIHGTVGQSDTGEMSGNAFAISGGYWQQTEANAGECSSVADCADLDGNGIRDDACVYWRCVDGTCIGTDTVYADMGGTNGGCYADGAADGNDRFHALGCFANQTTTGATGYPCEVSPPAAFNVDVAQLAAPCTPDGICDGHDAFAALNAFEAIASCECASGPMPAATGSGVAAGQLKGSAGPSDALAQALIVDEVDLELIPARRSVATGDLLEVDVFIVGGTADLRGYQLHADSSPGLELVDMVVVSRKDHVFAGLPAWQAYNLATRQVLVGLDSAGIEASDDRPYLATLVYRVTATEGTLGADLQADADDAAQRTFLFPTAADGTIRVRRTLPASVDVVSRPGATPRKLAPTQ